LGAHSYDPGVSPALVVWTIEIPEGSVEVDLDEGEASLHLENVCSVFDAFTVGNSLNIAHPMGLVGAAINSLKIAWKCSTPRTFNNGKTFRGSFKEGSASISVKATTPATAPPFTPAAQDGFQFIAEPPVMTTVNFAQIGMENNGSLY
jgi:hypothetical protein